MITRMLTGFIDGRVISQPTKFDRHLDLYMRILFRWWQQPIGVVVPLLLVFVMMFAPQMKDMLSGVDYSELDTARQIYGSDLSFTWINALRTLAVGAAAAGLGFFSWYWTRAALMCKHSIDDVRRQKILRQEGASAHTARQAEDEDLDWSNLADKYAPRAGLFLAALAGAAPVFLFNQAPISGQTDIWGQLAPLWAIIPPILMLLFVIYRHRLPLSLGVEAPKWAWTLRTTGIFASAPFGWPVAVFLFISSWVAMWIVAENPEMIHDWMHAPAAAILALAFSIGPLVVALAVFRDASQVFILLLWVLLNWIQLKAPVIRRGSTFRRRAGEMVGFFAFLMFLAGLPLIALTSAVLDRNDVDRFFYGDSVYRVRTLPLPDPAMIAVDGEEGCYNGDQVLARSSAAQLAADPRWHWTAAVEQWRKAKVAARAPQDRGKPLPMILVAAEGGASRAAVWMLSALRLLDERSDGKVGQHIFAISGVSGGALGAGTYLQMQRAHPAPTAMGGINWDAATPGLRKLAREDLLSPSVATYFLLDTTRRVYSILFPFNMDRGVQLEKSFERYWRDGVGVNEQDARRGMVDLRARMDCGAPHLLLNATDARNGDRVIASTFSFASDNPDLAIFAASDDIVDSITREEIVTPDYGFDSWLGERMRRGGLADDDRRVVVGADLPLSTAVHNSARFPLISPAGRWTDCRSGAICVTGDLLSRSGLERQLLDGGYFENNGARTVFELAEAVSAEFGRDRGPQTPPIVPIILALSNDLNALGAGGAQTFAELVRRQRDGLDEPKALPAIERATLTCENSRALLAADSNDKSYATEIAAPALGVYAVREGQARALLAQIRRSYCPGVSAARSPEGRPAVGGDIQRFFHVNLVQPDPDKRQAAPMNWVLSPYAQRFMMQEATQEPFVLDQADKLNGALELLLR